MSVDTTTATDVQPVAAGPFAEARPLAAPSKSGQAIQPECCPPAEQQTCCDTSAKPGCCGADPEQGCGCR
jgi:hypothetical protein